MYTYWIRIMNGFGLAHGDQRTRPSSRYLPDRSMASERGVTMARSLEMTVRTVVVFLLGAEPREVFEYMDGARTDKPRLSADGRPLWRFDAAVEVDGQAVGACAVLTRAPEVAVGQTMGTRLIGERGTVKVMPDSQFEVRVTVTVPVLAPEKRQAAA